MGAKLRQLAIVSTHETVDMPLRGRQEHPQCPQPSSHILALKECSFVHVCSDTCMNTFVQVTIRHNHLWKKGGNNVM